MRMWMLNPEFMCRKHLLGEHVELHMLVGALNKNKNIDGFIENNLVQISSIESRHNILIQEMKNRGYKHKSPLPKFKIEHKYNCSVVNQEQNLKDLINRCPECNKLYENWKNR